MWMGVYRPIYGLTHRLTHRPVLSGLGLSSLSAMCALARTRSRRFIRLPLLPATLPIPLPWVRF